MSELLEGRDKKGSGVLIVRRGKQRDWHSELYDVGRTHDDVAREREHGPPQRIKSAMVYWQYVYVYQSHLALV